MRSVEREKKYQLITYGHIRNVCKAYDLNVPTEIVSIIFMFYFMKIFNIEHGQNIKVEENTITNIQENAFFGLLNTTVIDDWMDPNLNHIHTIKIKMVKQSGFITMGIVEQGYDVETSVECKFRHSIVSEYSKYSN